MHPTDSAHPPISETPTDLALLLTALRGLVRTWRERAVSAPADHAEIYHQVERDLSDLISGHADRKRIWTAARTDLVAALVEALLEGSPENGWTPR